MTLYYTSFCYGRVFSWIHQLYWDMHKNTHFYSGYDIYVTKHNLAV